MEIVWSAKATSDLEEAGARAGARDPIAGFRHVARIIEAVAHLGANPLLGRAGRWRGTRELIVADVKWVVVYFVGEAFIEILHVVPGRARTPRR